MSGRRSNWRRMAAIGPDLVVAARCLATRNDDPRCVVVLVVSIQANNDRVRLYGVVIIRSGESGAEPGTRWWSGGFRLTAWILTLCIVPRDDDCSALRSKIWFPGDVPTKLQYRYTVYSNARPFVAGEVQSTCTGIITGIKSQAKVKSKSRVRSLAYIPKGAPHPEGPGLLLVVGEREIR